MHLTLPIVLTLSRVAVIPVFVALFFLESATGQWIACGVFTLAAITDFFDGYLARARGQISAFGRFLDPVADKLLVASALLMMVGFGQVAKLAKWKTTIQMVAIGILILGNAAHPVIPETIPVRVIGEAGLWIAAVITIITGYDYLRAGLRHMDPPPAAGS